MIEVTNSVRALTDNVLILVKMSRGKSEGMLNTFWKKINIKFFIDIHNDAWMSTWRVEGVRCVLKVNELLVRLK